MIFPACINLPVSSHYKGMYPHGSPILWYIRKYYNYMMGIELQIILHWLVGCLGLYSPLRQYFSCYLSVSVRERERKKKNGR